MAAEISSKTQLCQELQYRLCDWVARMNGFRLILCSCGGDSWATRTGDTYMYYTVCTLKSCTCFSSRKGIKAFFFPSLVCKDMRGSRGGGRGPRTHYGKSQVAIVWYGPPREAIGPEGRLFIFVQVKKFSVMSRLVFMGPYGPLRNKLMAKTTTKNVVKTPLTK